MADVRFVNIENFHEIEDIEIFGITNLKYDVK